MLHQQEFIQIILTATNKCARCAEDMMSYRHHLRACLLESRQSSKLYSAMKLVLVSAVFAIALLCPLAGRYILYTGFQFIPSSLQKQVVTMKTFDFMTMERAAMLRECFKYVMVRGGQLYVIMAGGKSSQSAFAVNILTTKIQVCRSASLILLLCHSCSTFVNPKQWVVEHNWLCCKLLLNLPSSFLQLQ